MNFFLSRKVITILKKVLIISYYFPPGNFAGSYRIKSWAEYLHEFGYYPIVITRHWSPNETDFTAISDIPEKQTVKNEKYEIHYLPYSGGLRDRFHRISKGRLNFFSKLLSFFEIVLQNFFLDFCPYKNLFYEANTILQENNDIKLLITSGRPFYLFRFAYQLKKIYPYIEWLADYRDPWTTNPINNRSLKLKFLSLIDKPFEKKWTSNAYGFTTCSNEWILQIGRLINIPGFIILNGYDPDFFKSREYENLNKEFTIIYIGTLYENQPIDVFLKGFSSFKRKIGESRIQLIFVGAGSDPESVNKISKHLDNSLDSVHILPKIEQKKVFEMLRSSDVCLMTNYEGEKGRYTAKIFDYLASSKPIILCPSDGDVMEKLIHETQSGFIINSSDDAEELLDKLYQQWLESGVVKSNPKWMVIESYSRKNQSRLLCEKFDEILNIKENEKLSTIFNCPLCNNSSLALMNEYKTARLAKCQTCGFVFSQKIPTEKELSDYYAKYSYGDDYYSSPLTSLRYDMLLEKFEPYRKHNRILDVGCGNGQFIEAAIKKGWEAWGTEYSKEAVLQVQIKGLNVLQGRLDDLLDILPQFDIITSFEVIEHINNPANELKLMDTLLRPGGIIYITTPNFNSVLRYLLKHRYDVITYPEHLSYYTPSTIKYLMQSRGFKVKKIESTGFSFSRLRNGLTGKIEDPFTSESMDEKFRIFLESNFIFRLIKSSFDRLFTLSGTGLSIKGWFEKRS
jgi:glycosyltransferase involved in cell wall biosynthesis/2-polyprenyl-3-methyl-5-hydroxy-6-metoxy-1,4-benzoquinol methylase